MTAPRFVWARRVGLLTGLLSARASASTALRAQQLGIPIVKQGVEDKLSAYQDILAEHGLTDDQVSFMGDDVLDLPVLARVGLSCAPADAVPDVRSRVHWVSERARRRGRHSRVRRHRAARAGPLAGTAGQLSSRGGGRGGGALMDPLIAALLALLLGLAAGKAWERYKLQEGRWIDRRKARESPHYMQGLNFLVGNQLDLAIDEISQAAKIDPDALEIHMILGNLYREKGQVGRAVQIHQQLLQRPRLRALEHTYVQLCLGLDYKRGGFVDRAIVAFNEVLRLDPRNEHALLHLERLYEDQHQWEEARSIRERLTKIVRPSLQARHQAIQAFLENELGMQARGAGDLAGATRHFKTAIDLDTRVVPAYLNLGDVTLAQGDPSGAAEIWEKLTRSRPNAPTSRSAGSKWSTPS